MRPTSAVVVRVDHSRPGDDEDVPAGLERGRHCPQSLAKSPTDPVADDRAAELAPGRQPEPRRFEVGPQEANEEERVGPEGTVALKRREVLWAREHHEPRPLRRRARRSDRQPLAAPCAPSSQHPPAAGRLHAGAEAVLLGAMALLRLVGLLHAGCARSFSFRPRGRRSTPRGTQTRRAPISAVGASLSGGLYGRPKKGVKRATGPATPPETTRAR